VDESRRLSGMRGLLRRLRGLLGVGVTWGALWGGIGAGIGVIVSLATGQPWALSVVDWALGMCLYGLVSGFGFGALLALREGRRTLFELSLPRSAVWGILGALAVPLLFGALGTFEPGTTAMDVLGAILVTGALGGAFAPASIAAARRAELSAGRGPDLLDGPGPV
jgi:hypothetical protein